MLTDSHIDVCEAAGQQELPGSLWRIKRESVSHEGKLLHKCPAGDGQAKCAAKLQHPSHLCELDGWVLPKIEGVYRKHVVKRPIGEWERKPVCPFKTHTAGGNVMFVDFPSLVNHRFRPVCAGVVNTVTSG